MPFDTHALQVLSSTIAALSSLGCNPTPTNGGSAYTARCPCHDDSTPSLSISQGDKQPVILHCHAGCDPREILKALGIQSNPATDKRRIVATYDYHDAQGALVSQKVRYEPKDFRQRWPDSNGCWLWKRPQGAPHVLYRLPELLAAIEKGEPVYLVEGEKDADRLAALGLTATTNVEGAAKPDQKAKWRPDYTAQLSGAARVILIPDNDEPGRAHMAHVAKALGQRASVVNLSGIPEKGDVSDWLNKGHSADELKALADNAEAGPGTRIDEQEGDALLIRGDQKGLVRHNEAAEILFNVEFGRRLFYDPVALEWFEYQDSDGVFKHRPSLAIEQAVYRAIRQHSGWMGFDAAYVGGVTKCLLYEAVREARPASGKICFTNGVLDLATMTLLPHSPNHHFLHSMPYAWTPDASEPTAIIEWLHEAVGGNDDQVQLLRAYLNAVVVGRPDLQRFLELVGPGGSGKGTFTRLATALIGDSATHTTQLKQLEENRFESAKLFGKKLVIINDAEKWHGDVSMLKSITGEDAIRFEQKHKQAGESFTYGGMVIIAANQYTESSDYSSGIQRRRISVPFDHVIDASQRRDLAGEFQPHLPAFLKWVLDMPQASVTAYLRNTSAQVNSLREARLDALRATNPLAAWVLDNGESGESFSTRIGEKIKLSIHEVDGYKRTVTRTVYENEDDHLYPNYCRWCDTNGKMPISKNSFAKTLLDVANNMLGWTFVKRHRTTEGRFIKGIKIKGSSCQPNVNLCQPNVNLMSTYPIESADNVNLSQIIEGINVSTYSSPSPPVEIATCEDLEEKARENGVGCHDEHYQALRLTLGQHKVDIGQHGPTLVDIGQHEADTKQPSRVSIEPTLVVTAPPIKPAALKCSWNNDNRLLTKCAKPAPNADRTGCASCGAVKEGEAQHGRIRSYAR